MRFFNLLLILTSSLAWSTSPPNTAIYQWENTIKLGATINTGNSDNTNLSGNFESNLDHKKWNYQLGTQGQLNTANGQRTAENIKGDAAARYFFLTNYYAFSKGNITYDAFSTYDFVIRAAVGLGHIFLQNDKHKLVLEAGPGTTHQRVAGTDEFQNSMIGNISGLYRYNISATASFQQTAGVDIGSPNTHTEAVSAIKTKVADGLALEISFTIKNDSIIPAGSTNTKRTDTISKVSVVYDF
jgi:putative salt-induced outer membrane protein